MSPRHVFSAHLRCALYSFNSIQGPRASRLPLATFSTRLQRAQSRSKLIPRICSTPNKVVALDTGEQIVIMPRLGKNLSISLLNSKARRYHAVHRNLK